MPGEFFYTDAADFSSGWLPLILIKESSKEGKIWDVRIIDAGWSKNGVYYAGSVLDDAKHLFEGAKVNAFQFKDHYFDHLPDDASEIVKQGFARNMAGWLDNIRNEKVNGKDGLSGKFHVTDPFFRETFKSAWEEGKKNLLGFSIDAKGKLMPGVAEGKSGKIAKKIKKVNSLDIVTLPAAGGRLMRMVASQGGKTMDENIKKLIEMVRENPGILGLQEGENLEEKSDEQVLGLITEAIAAQKKKGEGEDTEEAKKAKEAEEAKKAKEAQEAKEAAEGKTEEEKKKAAEEEAAKEAGIQAADLQKIMELIKANKMEDALKAISDIMAKSKTEKEEAPAQASQTPPEGEKTELSPELKAKIEEVDKALDKVNVRESDLRLKEILGDDKILPEPVKAKIQKQFEGQVFEEDVLQESIKLEKEVLAELSASGEVTGMGTDHITTGLEPDDRLQIALHKLMGVEPTDKEKEDFAKVPEFEGIREAYQRYTGDKDVRGQIDERMREAVSSDFPNALGTSMERRLLKEFSRVPINAAWRKFVVIDKPSNFKRQDLIRLGGLSDLPVVAEDGQYTEFVSPSEEQANYTVTKKGKIFKVTREMIKNDDLRIIKKIPVKMGQAAARTLAKFVFDLMINYGGVPASINGGVLTYDALALYHATHANVTYDALDFDTLDLGITAIGNQTEPDSGETLGIQAKFVVVPYEQRGLAKVLVDSEKRPIVATSGAKTGTVESINPNYQSVEPIIIPKGYLRNDQNNWYLVGDPADLEIIVVGFLDGRETPEILLQDAPGVDQVFTFDRIKYKIRHEYNGCVADHRGLYGGIVAGIS